MAGSPLGMRKGKTVMLTRASMRVMETAKPTVDRFEMTWARVLKSDVKV
jgi:hypothetical protein